MEIVLGEIIARYGDVATCHVAVSSGQYGVRWVERDYQTWEVRPTHETAVAAVAAALARIEGDPAFRREETPLVRAAAAALEASRERARAQAERARAADARYARLRDQLGAAVKALRWRRMALDVPLKTGTSATVFGIASGPFLVHRPVEGTSSRWTATPQWDVTHIPTKLMLGSVSVQQRDAKAVVSILLRLPIPWESDSPREILKAVRKSGINVPAILEGPYDEAILTMAFGRLREAGAEVEVVEDDGR